jgi:hypothetical protein
LFDAVQQKLTDQWTAKTRVRNASNHLLTGLLFDEAGHRMAPTHATKAGIRYRYCVSLPCLHRETRTTKVDRLLASRRHLRSFAQFAGPRLVLQTFKAMVGPSIAVLPFQNMSGDPEQDYFADGLVEDIITALSRFRGLFVIDRAEIERASRRPTGNVDAVTAF